MSAFCLSGERRSGIACWLGCEPLLPAAPLLSLTCHAMGRWALAGSTHSAPLLQPSHPRFFTCPNIQVPVHSMCVTAAVVHALWGCVRARSVGCDRLRG